MFCLHVYLCEVRSPEIRVTGSYKLPCGCWKSNPDPREDQPVFLMAESSLQPTLTVSCRLQVQANQCCGLKVKTHHKVNSTLQYKGSRTRIHKGRRKVLSKQRPSRRKREKSNFFPLSIQAPSGLDNGHLCWLRPSALLCPLIQILMCSRNTAQIKPEIMFYQIFKLSINQLSWHIKHMEHNKYVLVFFIIGRPSSTL